MGANCCGGEEKINKEANLMKYGGRHSPKRDFLNKIPIMEVIKV